MTRKPKVAIVVGSVRRPRLLAMFEHLKDHYEPCVYALNSPGILERHDTNLKIKLFPHLEDMPGYMRGLEEELESSSLIIGMETSRLSTFQALRVARRRSVPFGVLVNEFQPFFYDRFPSIKAIQVDICSKTDYFWTTSQMAAKTLGLNGVVEGQIRQVSPMVFVDRFRYMAGGREKFRNYIGIGQDEIVILLHQDLTDSKGPEDVIRALQLLARQTDVDVSRLRLLIAGNGDQASDLKYLCSDLGVGSRVMFLHQDPEPFLVDLYSAVDIVISLSSQVSEHQNDLPLETLEAMSCSTAAVVGLGSLGFELAKEAACTIEGESFQALAAVLYRLYRDPNYLKRARSLAREVVVNHYGVKAAGRMVDEVCRVVEEAQAKSGPVARTQLTADQIRASWIRGQERLTVEQIEEGLLLHDQDAQSSSELWVLKGDVLYSMGMTEKAMEAFGEALRRWSGNHRALKGLGLIAWRNHSNEDALTFYKKTLALKGDDAEAMLGIGLIYRRLGLNEEAMFWLERCVLQPEAPPSALAALSQTCMEANLIGKAMGVLERVMESIGERPVLLMTLGQLYLQEGKTELADQLLKKANKAPVAV